MSSYIQWTKLLKFADDFYTITTLSDSNSLQEDITSLFCWSMDSDLNFNLKKFVQLSFKCNFNTTYTMDNTPIPQVESHKDIFSEDLSWSKCLCLQNLRTHMPHFCFQPFTSYTSQTVHITGKISITLLHSAMAPLLNERYTLLRTNPVSLHQTYT